MPATSSPATALRYRDVAAAADWLCAAFGFEKQTVVTGESGATVYAQLTFGRAMLMLAPARDTPLDKFMKQPDEVGGAETQCCYFVVADADAHYARAKGGGAEIVLDVQDDDFGGRGYTCRDPEGHVWSFGTYDPWQGKHPQPAVAAAGGGRWRLVLAGLVATVVASGVAAAWVGGVLRQSSAVSSTAQVQAPAVAEKAPEAKERAADEANAEALKSIAEEQRARGAAERAARELRTQLDRERAAKATADKASEDALKRVAEEQRAKDAAQRSARELREELERERAGKAAAEMAKDFALALADQERLAREAAERTAGEAREQLERELAGKPPPDPSVEDAAKRTADTQRALEQAKRLAADAQRAREAAERATQEAREQLAREQAAKAAAWKVVGQLTQQLKQVQGGSPPPAEAANAGNDNSAGPPPKKARPRPRQKKSAEPDADQ